MSDYVIAIPKGETMPNEKVKDNTNAIVGCSLLMVSFAISLFLCIAALAVFAQYVI